MSIQEAVTATLIMRVNDKHRTDAHACMHPCAHAHSSQAVSHKTSTISTIFKHLQRTDIHAPVRLLAHACCRHKPGLSKHMLRAMHTHTHKFKHHLCFHEQARTHTYTHEYVQPCTHVADTHIARTICVSPHTCVHTRLHMQQSLNTIKHTHTYTHTNECSCVRLVHCTMQAHARTYAMHTYAFRHWRALSMLRKHAHAH